jgi:hypothetical protein
MAGLHEVDLQLGDRTYEASNRPDVDACEAWVVCSDIIDCAIRAPDVRTCAATRSCTHTSLVYTLITSGTPTSALLCTLQVGRSTGGWWSALNQLPHACCGLPGDLPAVGPPGLLLGLPVIFFAAASICAAVTRGASGPPGSLLLLLLLLGCLSPYGCCCSCAVGDLTGL